MIDVVWEEKLKFLVDQDHQLREIFLTKGTLNDTYHPELEKLHLNNARKLAHLIEKMGFPVLSNAGENGVRLSWLIIHHAIVWPDFMRESLIQMRLAAGQGDYILELLAYTDDRIAYLEGRPQLYGTNLDWIDGELRRTPVEEPDKLNLRRKSLGLPPVDETSVFMTGMGRPPANPKQKEQDFKQWLVKTGWRTA